MGNSFSVKSDSSKSDSSKSDSSKSDSSKSDSSKSGSSDSSNNNPKNKKKTSETNSSDPNIKKNYKTHQELIILNWYDVIKNKLQKDEEICKSLGIQSEEQLDNLINSLGDEKIFLDRYLKLEEVYNDENLQQMTKDLQEINALQENNFIPSEEDGRNLINGLLRHRRESDKFNVYLFISKLADGRSDSPFFRSLARDVLRNRYGMFHVGLEIDGIVLEWGTGDAGPHLIYPKINTSRMFAYVRINYSSNFSKEFNDSTNNLWDILRNYISNLLSSIKDIFVQLLSHVMNIGVIPSNKLQIIAQKCVFWNKYLTYHPLNRNCQHFIDEMLKALGLKFNPEGEFKKFLDRIVKHADDRFLFHEEEFLSRQDLDQYVDQNWYNISNIWDKKLLLCYSDMMNCMYTHDKESKWGPMEMETREKWEVRGYELKEY